MEPTHPQPQAARVRKLKMGAAEEACEDTIKNNNATSWFLVQTIMIKLWGHIFLHVCELKQNIEMMFTFDNSKVKRDG